MNVLMGARPLLGAGRVAGMGMGGGWFGPLASLGFLILLGVMVALMIWAIVRKPKTVVPATVAPASDTALAIARERLARGEIDAEQYVTIFEALMREQVQASPSLEG